MKRTIYVLSILFMTISCNKTDNAKIEGILDAEDVYIQQNTYGGMAGYHEQHFHLKKGEFETLMIINEGTDYQNFVRMEGKEDLLKAFLEEAVATDDPGKSMSNSCVTGMDSEYIIKNGLTTVTLRPGTKSDSIFDLILYKNEVSNFVADDSLVILNLQPD